MALYDRVKFTTATTGTGPITVGSAVAGFRTPAQASIPNAGTFPYVIEDGTAWEIGTGTYTSAGTTVARVLVSSSTAALLNLSGSAVMYATAPASLLQAIETYGQIKFPATQVPSTDVNTLDDYEEFTFTPDLRIGGSATGITYAANFQDGRGIKIGKRVTIEIEIALSSKGVQTGAVTILGLPFAAATGMITGISIAMPSNLTSVTNVQTSIASGASAVTLWNSAAGAITALADTNLQNASQFYISLFYTAAA